MRNNAVFDKPHRLKTYNYSSQGSYMVTFNTANRNPILSEVCSSTGMPQDAHVSLTEIGNILNEFILQIPAHYKNVFVDSYVIMPDHVHILLTFTEDGPETAVEYSKLSSIVHALKRMVTKKLGYSVWQFDYYDSIAFTDKSYDAFLQYIADNPIVWFARGAEPEINPY